MSELFCRKGHLYSASFAAIAVSAAQDVFEIVSGSGVVVAIREIRLGQYTDFGDAASEILSVRLIRGFTTGGSGGGTITPVNIANTSGRAATSVVERNNTTQAQDGGETVLSDTWNIAAPWLYEPEPAERIILPPSTRLVLALTAPADEVTANGSLIFEEFE